MSWQANAEPRIGPTRPARSRTMLALSLAAAPSPANKAQDKKKIAQRVFIAVDPRLCFFVGWKYVLGAAIARSGTMADVIRTRLPGTSRFHQAPCPIPCAKPGVRRGRS